MNECIKDISTQFISTLVNDCKIEPAKLDIILTKLINRKSPKTKIIKSIKTIKSNKSIKPICQYIINEERCTTKAYKELDYCKKHHNLIEDSKKPRCSYMLPRNKVICNKIIRDSSTTEGLMYCNLHKNKKVSISKATNIRIYRNKFGYFEHKATSFVIVWGTKLVTGKQQPDGTIDPILTQIDIIMCKNLSLDHIIDIEERKEKIKEVIEEGKQHLQKKIDKLNELKNK